MSQQAVNALRQVLKMTTKSQQFARVFSALEVVSAGDGHCTCELKVEEQHENQQGALHGGMTATLVDVVSTLGLMTKEPCVPGVSVEMSISYFRPGKTGDVLVIDSRPLKIGRTLSTLEVFIKRKPDGALVAHGKHTKHMGQ